MRVSSHRGFVEGAESNPHDPTLHRVVLATRGKSMVSYTSFTELLSAAECAAEGMQAILSQIGMTLTSSQGLHSLSQLGVDHRDVSIGNVLLGTDPDKAAGFISDLDLSSIREEAIKAAYPNDYDTVIKQLKDGEWRTVCNYRLEATWTAFSYNFCAQGTALFMARRLLYSFTSVKRSRDRRTTSDFTFQHRLCHDLESLIWVVVYAMMIHQRNIFAATDSEMFELYKEGLDQCWAAHAYSNLLMSHNHMSMTGSDSECQPTVSSWFPDAREAEFFCDVMCMILRIQTERQAITYERLCALFKKHINLAKEPLAVDVVLNDPC